MGKFADEYLNYKNCEQPAEPESSFIRNFVDGLHQEKSIPLNYSIYFPQVIFIKKDLTSEIFLQFKNLFDLNIDLEKIKFPLKVSLFLVKKIKPMG